MNIQKRQQIRSEIRKIRANLTALQQQQAEQSVTQQALNLIDQRQAKNIALYFSFDGEISTKTLIQSLWIQNKKCVFACFTSFYSTSFIVFTLFT